MHIFRRLQPSGAGTHTRRARLWLHQRLLCGCKYVCTKIIFVWPDLVGWSDFFLRKSRNTHPNILLRGSNWRFQKEFWSYHKNSSGYHYATFRLFKIINQPLKIHSFFFISITFFWTQSWCLQILAFSRVPWCLFLSIIMLSNFWG